MDVTDDASVQQAIGGIIATEGKVDLLIRFGSVNRAAQLLFAVAIWGFQLIFSSGWMTRFRYGPLGWLWRSLPYGRLQ